MGELGFLGAPIPEEYGGAGLDYISFAHPVRGARARRHGLPGRAERPRRASTRLTLLQWATDEQKQRWLVPQARGEKLATFGLTEPGVGTDAGSAAVDRPPRGRRLRPQRAQDLDQPGRPRRPLPRLRLGRPREAAPGRDRVHGRAGDEGAHDRDAPRQARDPGGQHRAHRLRRRRGAGREPDRRGGRGLPRRHERHRPGAVHGGGGRRGPRPGLPRRVASSTPTSARRSARRSAGTSWSSR